MNFRPTSGKVTPEAFKKRISPFLEHHSGLMIAPVLAATPENVFGFTPNEVMAYSAIASTIFAAALIGVTLYYAWRAGQQAKASQQQVDASNRQVEASIRQAETAQRTLELLLTEKQEQREADISAVHFQIEGAIHMIDHWKSRIEGEESYEVPEVIEISPANFAGAITRADRLDHLVAGYMGAGLLFIATAETDIRAMRDQRPDLCTSPAQLASATESRRRLQERAAKHLNVARFKLEKAKIRLGAVSEQSPKQQRTGN